MRKVSLIYSLCWLVIAIAPTLAQGAPKDVINRYIGLVLEKQPAEGKEERLRSSFRHGRRQHQSLRSAPGTPE